MKTAPFSWLTDICGQLTADASGTCPEDSATVTIKTAKEIAMNFFEDLRIKLVNILPASKTFHVLKEMWRRNIETAFCFRQVAEPIPLFFDYASAVWPFGMRLLVAMASDKPVFGAATQWALLYRLTVFAHEY
jgi:hypothetical protein